MEPFLLLLDAMDKLMHGNILSEDDEESSFRRSEDLWFKQTSLPPPLHCSSSVSTSLLAWKDKSQLVLLKKNSHAPPLIWFSSCLLWSNVNSFGVGFTLTLQCNVYSDCFPFVVFTSSVSIDSKSYSHIKDDWEEGDNSILEISKSFMQRSVDCMLIWRQPTFL